MTIFLAQAFAGASAARRTNVCFRVFEIGSIAV